MLIFTIKILDANVFCVTLRFITFLAYQLPLKKKNSISKMERWIMMIGGMKRELI